MSVGSRNPSSLLEQLTSVARRAALYAGNHHQVNGAESASVGQFTLDVVSATAILQSADATASTA
ncbi:hypothetical protein ABH922_004515 [Rhodococcus sp. 27YEA15]|uniref:hypothetical protein n=1 Tax=Rhodococcus sp. 27YEA15 TaxID=3156259 RepID=UPI003C7B298D